MDRHGPSLDGSSTIGATLFLTRNSCWMIRITSTASRAASALTAASCDRRDSHLVDRRFYFARPRLKLVERHDGRGTSVMRNLAILLLACSAFAIQSASAVERGCKARLYIEKDDWSDRLDEFSARGTAVHPNNAREEARARALACARAARDFRSEHREPDKCQTNARVDRFDLASIEVAIEASACRRPTAQGGTYYVRLQTWGDKGCSANEFIMSHTVTFSICDKVGTWEIHSDRPGSDYKDFEYEGVDPARCQAECDKDPRCRSWTVVGWIPNRPGYSGVQGERPNISRSHCWLKNAVPGWQWANSTISGVKGILGNTDFPGGDYRSISLTSSDPSTCKKICDRDQRCRAWTTVPEPYGGAGDFDQIKQVCWLKDHVGPPNWKPYLRSGLKQ